MNIARANELLQTRSRLDRELDRVRAEMSLLPTSWSFDVGPANNKGESYYFEIAKISLEWDEGLEYMLKIDKDSQFDAYAKLYPDLERDFELTKEAVSFFLEGKVDHSYLPIAGFNHYGDDDDDDDVERKEE